MYQRIAADLRKAIKDGEYGPGDRLPTEAELCATYEVTRETVRRGLGLLIGEGLLSSAVPSGYTVRRWERLTYYASRSGTGDRQTISARDAFMAEVEQQGRQPDQSINVAIMEADAEVAGRLDLQAGDLVGIRQRVRYVDGQPSSTSDSYYPLELVKNTPIMSPRDIPQGVIAVMASVGINETHCVDELTWRMPTPIEASRLEIPPGVPVLIHFRTGYAEERPIRVAVTVMPGDRHRLLYELPAERRRDCG
jgi:DNA-binding GntR family transcriptional regulator